MIRGIKQISVRELKTKLDNKEKIRLIDVREPSEYEVARIEGAELIPLGEFGQKALQLIQPDEEVVVHCHHGGRSQRACEYLKASGYLHVANVTGGIDQWSLEIDRQVKRY